MLGRTINPDERTATMKKTASNQTRHQAPSRSERRALQLAAVVRRNLIERGLDPHRPTLFVIDGSKALRKAIRDRFDKRMLVQRCQTHKQRNLPKKLPPMVTKTMRDAYQSRSKATAKQRSMQFVSHLGDDHPDAAASLREGLDETLTLKGMNLSPSLE